MQESHLVFLDRF